MQSSGNTRRYVFGRIQRLLHWWLALTIVGLAVTGAIAQWGLEAGRERIVLVEAHAYVGMAFAAGVALRILWSVIGPEPARVVTVWRTAWRLRSRRHVHDVAGYDPKGSVAYLGLYACSLISALTGLGLAAIRYDLGPFSTLLFDDFSGHALYLMSHQAASYVIIAFIPAHLFGMMRHEKSSGYPVAQAMVSGYKYEPPSEKESV